MASHGKLRNARNGYNLSYSVADHAVEDGGIRPLTTFSRGPSLFGRSLTFAFILSLTVAGTTLSSENPFILKGRISTYLYSFEEQNPDTSSERQVLSYESFDLDCFDVGTSGLSFHSYLRTLNNPRENASDRPSTKIYNLYLQYDKLFWQGNLRVGRQFLYSGVARGKMDGIKMDVTPVTGFSITGFLGTREPEGLSTKIDSWSSSNTWGARIRVDRITDTQVGWSFNQRSRGDEEEARLIGIDLRSRSIPRLDLYGKFDWDHIAKRTSYLVFRASSRIGPRLSLSGEFARHNPQIRSNSILSVFRQENYDQVRIRPYYRLTERLGLEGGYSVVGYHEDKTHRVDVGVNFGKGNAGVIHRTGYGGETTGGYGSLYLDLMKDLPVQLYANYQKYRTVEETSPLLESFVTSASFGYSGLEPLNLSIEFQEAWNPLVESDFRFFFRANYRLRVMK